MFQTHINIEEVSDYINQCSPETQIYIGVDSERFRLDGVWWVDYVSAVVVHIDGKHGCKVFGAVQREQDFGGAANKPKMRLMNEVYRAADLYLALSKMVAHDISVHLDINPNEMYGSSVAVQEAIGYIRGVCGITPMIKPNAPAASYCADAFKSFDSRRVA